MVKWSIHNYGAQHAGLGIDGPDASVKFGLLAA